ncbi:MAG: arsenate reductase family protein [Lactobacillus sp.]|jgi:arsenate reductase|nr:arsenate reductase family protein [Lactobacillus sp.]MCH3905999.1 arsenate reductase family protein [Lactobacillus sp.]MCH3990427.1 arsenate reductase family protein [Lactobacillus sp.]MCH4068858.1 arsenate reductase family protein [Lactobacillus sp.]MCI1329336.1 arsenate reductase family protein [Lactobacillus sp.]
MIKFYGYKRCSTSKKAEKWLTDHNVKYDFQDLVEDPPTKAELIKWMTDHQDLGLRYFFNTSGQHYRALKLKDKVQAMTVEEAAELMSKDGKLIKRPLVVSGNKLTCGFKEDIFEKTWL